MAVYSNEGGSINQLSQNFDKDYSVVVDLLHVGLFGGNAVFNLPTTINNYKGFIWIALSGLYNQYSDCDIFVKSKDQFIADGTIGYNTNLLHCKGGDTTSIYYGADYNSNRHGMLLGLR